MAIRGDSYGTVAEVLAYTRYLLDGETTFNSTTRPTLTEVEKFIDRTSGILNTALSGGGFTPSTISANSTAKLSLDDWVVLRAAQYVEITQRGGWTGDNNERFGTFENMHADAVAFVEDLLDGWKNLGITVADPDHQGLTFTGLTLQKDRTDPDNTGREQPKFRRGLFDNA